MGGIDAMAGRDEALGDRQNRGESWLACHMHNLIPSIGHASMASAAATSYSILSQGVPRACANDVH